MVEGGFSVGEATCVIDRSIEEFGLAALEAEADLTDAQIDVLIAITDECGV
jgi:hypothetical protein